VRGCEQSLRKICAKVVPKLLKERCLQVCYNILEQLETEPNLLERVITGDKSLIFEYKPETMCQSLQRKNLKVTEVKESEDGQSLLIAFCVPSQSDRNKFYQKAPF